MSTWSCRSMAKVSNKCCENQSMKSLVTRPRFKLAYRLFPVYSNCTKRATSMATLNLTIFCLSQMIVRKFLVLKSFLLTLAYQANGNMMEPMFCLNQSVISKEIFIFKARMPSSLKGCPAGMIWFHLPICLRTYSKGELSGKSFTFNHQWNSSHKYVKLRREWLHSVFALVKLRNCCHSSRKFSNMNLQRSQITQNCNFCWQVNSLSMIYTRTSSLIGRRSQIMWSSGARDPM